jgi:hypothetical protein
MPVDKFESLVETGRLFFPSVALLAEEMDPFEGRLSAPTIGEFREIPAGEAADKVAERQAIADHNLGLIHASRQLLYVSCWHLAEYESAAMWQVYAGVGKGIAIKSTIGRLKAAFADESIEIEIGAVSYIDHATDPTPWSNAFFRALYKPRAYQSESEVRCVVLAVGDGRGMFVNVDVLELIEGVYVAPRSSPELRERVRDLLGKHGLDGTLRTSALDAPPSYGRRA